MHHMESHHELGRIGSSRIRLQHAVHNALAGEQQQRLFVQFHSEEQWRQHCGDAEQSFERTAPAGEDLSKEVPPHSNVGGGVWALHQHEGAVGKPIKSKGTKVRKGSGSMPTMTKNVSTKFKCNVHDAACRWDEYF